MHFIRRNKWIALAVLMLAISGSAMAQFRLSITFGPPAIPVYEQPLCPGEGYMWTPGYWAWDDDDGDYYWVPGTWVMAPQVGYLWTPAWWGWEGGVYLFHVGYWGPHIGFYGGINYGFGYTGDGYWGGRWDHDRFFYNRSVTNVNVTNITNIYNEHVTINNNSHVSYNGGEGGLKIRPTHEQEMAASEHHIEAVSAQRDHEQQARGNPELRASNNHGKPSIAATEKPGDFKGHVAPAKEAGGSYNHAPLKGGAAAGGEARGGNAGGSYGHVKDLPKPEPMPKPNTGDSKLDNKYQKQQDKLSAQQDKERTKLAAQQEKEHLQLDKQKANEQQKQQVEQKHQQQTQQLAEKHTQQRTEMQSHQSAPPPKKK